MALSVVHIFTLLVALHTGTLIFFVNWVVYTSNWPVMTHFLKQTRVAVETKNNNNRIFII